MSQDRGNRSPDSGLARAAQRAVRVDGLSALGFAATVQGYLAQQKAPLPPKETSSAPRHTAIVGSWGEAFYYELGTPVGSPQNTICGPVAGTACAPPEGVREAPIS